MLARVKPAAETSPGAALTEDITNVLLQFMVDDEHQVPGWMWRAKEPPNGRTQPGEKIILPHLFVGLWAFVHELLDAGYALQDAYALGRTFGAAIRFVYARAPKNTDPRAGNVLQELCKKSSWQTCAFLNPLESGRGISVNCNQRTATSERQPAAFLRVIDGRLLMEPA